MLRLGLTKVSESLVARSCKHSKSPFCFQLSRSRANLAASFQLLIPAVFINLRITLLHVCLDLPGLLFPSSSHPRLTASVVAALSIFIPSPFKTWIHVEVKPFKKSLSSGFRHTMKTSSYGLLDKIIYSIYLKVFESQLINL